MMHSWGTIFVQDIVVPLRKRPMATKQHVNLLRAAVVGVALFAFCFSALIPQTTYINMFLAITSAVFMGAGACIIGGFYWKRGTTSAAWAAMIGAALVALVGETLAQTWKPWLYPWLAQNAAGFLQSSDAVLRAISNTIPNLNWHVVPSEFFLNRMWITCFAALTAIVAYVGATFLTYRQPFNLDRMLHRGPYAIAGEHKIAESAMGRRKFSFKTLVGITPEFTTSDKAISLSLFGYRIAWFVVFAVITIWNIPQAWRWSEASWIAFWRVTAIWLPFVIAIVMVVWFTWGGLRDIKQLFARLRTAQRDALDDGTVVGHENLDDAVAEHAPAIKIGSDAPTFVKLMAPAPRD
jgi:SSS family solute:Na+ symporter